MNVPKRKYVSEWTLVLTVLAAAVGRQQDFQEVGPPPDYDCHLYLVTTRPRMSIEPTSVVITDHDVSFTLRLQRGQAFDEYPLAGGHELGPGPWRWKSEWPFEEFEVVHGDTGQVAMSAVVAALQQTAGKDWPQAASEHEVLYVGQSYGADGDRTAWDRLKSHSTLQQILSEVPPDQQVWLTLAAVTEVAAAQLMGGPDAPEDYPDDELDRDARIAMAVYRDGSFRERDSVALAEAGLIRYFQPKYNDRLKRNFPTPRQVPLVTARSFDFHGLVVELQGQHVGASYGSAFVEFNSIHFERFVIHSDADDRADPFAFLTPAE